jgi:hypothetical protein
VVFKKVLEGTRLWQHWRKDHAPLIHCRRTSTFRVELRESLTELVAVDAFPARLRVWQSTYGCLAQVGNYGAAWPSDEWQVLPVDPTAVAHWNKVAWEVLQPFSNDIAVMDAYWLYSQSTGSPSS